MAAAAIVTVAVAVVCCLWSHRKGPHIPSKSSACKLFVAVAWFLPDRVCVYTTHGPCVSCWAMRNALSSSWMTKNIPPFSSKSVSEPLSISRTPSTDSVSFKINQFYIIDDSLKLCVNSECVVEFCVLFFSLLFFSMFFLFISVSHWRPIDRCVHTQTSRNERQFCLRYFTTRQKLKTQKNETKLNKITDSVHLFRIHLEVRSFNWKQFNTQSD